MKFVVSFLIILVCCFWIVQRRAQWRADQQRERAAARQAQVAFQQEMDALNPHLSKDK